MVRRTQVRPAAARKHVFERPAGEEFMKRWRPIDFARLSALAALLSFVAPGARQAQAAETLNVCHGGHPIMEASIKILDKWAKKFDVNLASTTVAYAIFVPKITQILTTNSPQCDIIWHNDDWGQLWKQYLATEEHTIRPGYGG